MKLYFLIYLTALVSFSSIMSSEHKNTLPFIKWLKSNENRLKDIIEDKEDTIGHISKAGIRYLMFSLPKELKTTIAKDIVKDIAASTKIKLIERSLLGAGTYALNLSENSIVYQKKIQSTHDQSQTYLDKINKCTQQYNDKNPSQAVSEPEEVYVNLENNWIISIHHPAAHNTEEKYPIFITWGIKKPLSNEVINTLTLYTAHLLLDLQTLDEKDNTQDMPSLTNKTVLHYKNLREKIKKLNRGDSFFDEETWQKAMSQQE